MVKDFFKKLVKEYGKDALQGAVIDYGIQATFNYAFDDKYQTFNEAAAPSNINWLSVAASVGESAISYKNIYAELGITMSIECFVNGLSDSGGFKDSFSVQDCAIGIVQAILGKLTEVGIAKLGKFVKPLAKYSREQLKKGLKKIGIEGNKADEVIESIKKEADENSDSSPGSSISNKIDIEGKTNNTFDEVNINSLDLPEIAAEIIATNNSITNSAKKFWQNHEINVTKYLQKKFGRANVGRQITVEVTIKNPSGISITKRLRIDNLIYTGPGKPFKIIDAKSSIVKELNTFNASKLATQTSTSKSKMVL